MINEKVVSKIAAKYLWTGMSFEDLQSEVRIIMLKAMEKYDPTKGANPITWQWNCCKQDMKAVIAKELSWKNKTCDYSSDWVPVESQPTRAFEITTSFSPEAKQVCAAIFNAPAEYMGLMPKMARGRLVRQFRGEGWSWPTIWKVFNEIKSALN